MSKAKLTFLGLAVVLLAAALWTAAGQAAAQSRGTGSAVIRGVIRSADGSPMEGVVVSARASTKTFTTSVFTDRQGMYYFPPQDAGQYKVWAQAVGFEAGRAELALAGSGQVHQNLTLAPNEDLRQTIKQSSGTELLLSLPNNTPDDRRGKRWLGSNPGASFVLFNPKTERFTQFPRPAGMEGSWEERSAWTPRARRGR